MKNVGWSIVVMAGVSLLSGCASASISPTVAVTPGPNKDAAAFREDQTACMSIAQQQIAGDQQKLNGQHSASAFLNGVAGALDSVSSGDKGADVANAAVKGASDTDTDTDTQATIQQTYDAAFGQCMYSRGNVVPGHENTADAAEPIGPDRALVQAIQQQLIRRGYLGGGADGVLGPRTRSAIERFEQTAGMEVDGTASAELLGALRSSTATARRQWVAPSATKASAPASGTNWAAPSGASAGTPATTPAAPGNN